MMAALFEHGTQTLDQIISVIGKTDRGAKGNTEMMKRAIASGYITKDGDKFRLADEAEAQIADVIETMRPKNEQILVPSRSHNIFSSELRNYESKLFAGKRGYN